MGRLLSTPEVAGRLELSPRTLEKWRSEGRGPAYSRVGRVVRYDEDDLRAWVDQQRTNPEGGEASQAS